MNTHVSLEIAKLLKEKGYSWECEYFYKKGNYDKAFYLTTGLEYQSDKNCIWDWNLNGGKSGMLSRIIPYPNEFSAIYYSAPIIADVIMWLYEKYRIWVQGSFPYNNGKWGWVIFLLKEPLDNTDGYKNIMSLHHEPYWFNAPTEANEAAIEYILNNLI